MSEEGIDPQPDTPYRRRSIGTFLTEDISTKNIDFLLLLISLGVGCIDGFTFTELKVFSANQ